MEPTTAILTGLLVVAIVVIGYLWTRDRKSLPVVSEDEASKIIKAYAEKQKIKVELSEEQLKALMDQWEDWNPKRSAQITFFVKDKPLIEFKTASYSYRGDTCCV